MQQKLKLSSGIGILYGILSLMMNAPLQLVGMTSLGPILSKKENLFQVTCYEGTHPIGVFFGKLG
jgi:hypothetical protein